jgi:hypothetical protein
MPITQAEVLSYVQSHGPCVPNEIRQALKAQDNFIVGAILSELVNAGKLKVTDLSLGTSKFYYDPAKPESLERVGQYLNEKDVRAFQLLKDERVVRHTELTPLNRVAMTMIKDYSRPVRVQRPEGEELFWRYYLVSEEEAQSIIDKKWFLPKEKPLQPRLDVPVVVVEPTKPEQEPGVRIGVKPVIQIGRKKPVVKKEAAVQQELQKPEENKEEPRASLSEGFTKQVHDYFDSKKIGLLQVIANKKTEFTAVVNVPTAVGSVAYFCKAKAKKSASDGDIASALLEAQQHKLPLLYVAGGSLSKKAQELVATQRGILVVQPWA